MHKILFTGSIFTQEALEKLKSCDIEIENARTDFSEDELIAALSDKEGFILGGDEIATKRVVESAKNLKIIIFLGTGYERYVDVETATEIGIPVAYTPHANADSVAEFTVALLLDTVKKISYCNANTKKAIWQYYQTRDVRGKVLGIFGMGAIGSRVAEIMHRGFGMHILYTSRQPKPDIEKELQAEKVDLEELLQKSDIVSLHATYSPQTIGIIGKKELQMMKPEAILINADRPELVDGAALAEALQEGKISAAAFDGYYTQPLDDLKKDTFGLTGLPDDKFIVTPHTAFNTIEAREKMQSMLLESLTAVFTHQIPKYLINPAYKSPQT